MSIYESEAYAKGQAAAIASRQDGHLHMERFPNPYEYGSSDWQAWNLGWNNEIMQNG
jgi:hypothetical protein